MRGLCVISIRYGQMGRSSPNVHSAGRRDMRDTSQGPGWSEASDESWYTPELPDDVSLAPAKRPAHQAATSARDGSASNPSMPPGWWQDENGTWHLPERATAGTPRHAARRSPQRTERTIDSSAREPFDATWLVARRERDVAPARARNRRSSAPRRCRPGCRVDPDCCGRWHVTGIRTALTPRIHAALAPSGSGSRTPVAPRRAHCPGHSPRNDRRGNEQPLVL